MSDIFTSCMEQSYFLDVLKIGHVVPIFKSKEPLMLNIYRPISLLSVFSKNFEKHICKHSENHLTTNDFICEQQCEFMNGLSTDISVTKLLKHANKGVDSNKYGICVFFGS